MNILKIKHIILSAIILLTFYGCSQNTEDTVETNETHSFIEVETKKDTLRWFNATHGIIMELNGEDIEIYGGVEKNDETIESTLDILMQWWDIYDYESAEDKLNWLLEDGGDSEGFVNIMEMLENDGIAETVIEERVDLILAFYDITEETATVLANSYGYYEEFGADAIIGWDLSRAQAILGWLYVADIYTEEECYDNALEVARMIQYKFDSWDEFVASYLRGYEYWAEESSAQRLAIYEKLKAMEDSVYDLKFDSFLEKIW